MAFALATAERSHRQLLNRILFNLFYFSSSTNLFLYCLAFYITSRTDSYSQCRLEGQKVHSEGQGFNSTLFVFTTT